MSAEPIEIFNSDGDFLGISSRKEAHSLGLWHRGVHGFFFNEKGQLLIQKRSNFCDTFPGAIDCSISEHLSINETFEGALTRGCREELNISDISAKKLITYKMQYGPTDNMICELYTADIVSTSICFNPAEIKSIDFVEMESLLRQVHHTPQRFTSWFRQQLLWYFKEPNNLMII